MKRRGLPRTAIIQAILRSETVNPAVVRKEAYAVHVRRLPDAEGEAWVVRVVNAEACSPRTSEEDR